MQDEIDPSPQGLLSCLQVLAVEAAYLNLPRTFSQLQDAIRACQQESQRPCVPHAREMAELVH